MCLSLLQHFCIFLFSGTDCVGFLLLNWILLISFQSGLLYARSHLLPLAGSCVSVCWLNVCQQYRMLDQSLSGFWPQLTLKWMLCIRPGGCGLMAPAGSSARSLNCVMSQPLGRLTWHYVENQAWGVQSTFRFGMHQLAMVPWGHLPLKWQVLRFWSGILRRYCLLPYIWYAEDEGLANVIGSTTHYRHATPAAHFPECKWASEWVLFIFFLSKYDGVQPEKSWICIGDNLVS